MIEFWLTVARIAIVVALGAAGVLLGGKIVMWVFGRADATRPEETTPDRPAEPAPTLIAAGAQLRGGAWIGQLERLAIFATLVAGFPEGLAIALALKGLARYPELKATTSGAAERFIIGTFVSVLCASACAGLAWWLVRLF